MAVIVGVMPAPTSGGGRWGRWGLRSGPRSRVGLRAAPVLLHRIALRQKLIFV